MVGALLAAAQFQQHQPHPGAENHPIMLATSAVREQARNSRNTKRLARNPTLPAAAARCSGVLPSLSFVPALAPCSSSSGMTAVRPLLACP